MKAPRALALASSLLVAACSAQPKQPRPAAPPEEAHTMVLMKTSLGDVTVKLHDDKAPVTVRNFLRYADEGFYTGTVFHRVIDGFMIQGGGFDRDLNRKPTHEPVQNEATNGLSNHRGTLAMARTNVVDSATSQFFINVVDNPSLDHRDTTPGGFGYCVFGEVIEGMEVVDAIKGVPTGTRQGLQNVPLEPVEILSAERLTRP